jgi:hypothetical protein
LQTTRDSHQLGHDTSGSLDTHGQGADVDQQDVRAGLLSAQDTTLNGGTVSDGLVRVDTLGRLLSVEKVLEELLNLGDTGRSSDQDDLARVVCVFGELERPIVRCSIQRKLTSSIWSFLTPASFKTCSTGFMVFLKRSMLSSSNLALVRV